MRNYGKQRNTLRQGDHNPTSEERRWETIRLFRQKEDIIMRAKTQMKRKQRPHNSYATADKANYCRIV